MPDAGGLLLVHAHPDDEVFSTGGVIARSVAEDRRVDLVTCTGGEEGEIHDPGLDPEEARPRLGQIRFGELQRSLAALRGPGPGELRLHLLGYRDSGMMGTISNDDPRCFWQANLEEATGRLVALVREARPSAMVTYDANGLYGHPDHIRAHRVAMDAWEAAADGSRYPHAGPAHAVERFYQVAISRDGWGELIAEMVARGIPLPWDMDAQEDGGGEGEISGAEASSFGTPASDITTVVDVAAWASQKRAAVTAHRTQLQDFGWMLNLPDDLAARVMSPEHFALTRWRGGPVPADLHETSLFAS
jgi:N-acetyl-1-D-myo-inositol-2-amino-2-deoxy-alpha-D-glucopyranoside deacetylase